jgi:hypothetical protein
MDYRKTLAVVDDTHFYSVGLKWQHAHIETLSDLLEGSEKAGITHVWIVKGCALSARLASPDVPLIGWTLREMKGKRGYTYCSAIRNGKHLDDKIQVGWADGRVWPWLGCESPKTLLASIAYLETAVGVPLEWTPAHVALDVIRAKNASRWGWLTGLTTDLEKDCPVSGFRYGATCKELTDWKAPLGDGKYLIDIDGNSDYGAAMTGLNCGEGNPSWAGPGPDCERDWTTRDDPRYDGGCYNGKRPGFWCVEVFKFDSLFDGKRLPDFEDYRWMTTDMIEQLRQEGYHIIVKMGWYWKVYHQTLRSTVSDKEKNGLWDLRLIWRAKKGQSAAHENVYESIGSILHTVHGKLGDDDISQRRFYRPDLWAMVVAKAISRMMYRIVKIYRTYGILPVRIHIDGLKYVVDDPHMLDALFDADKLGGFKHVKTVEITQEMREKW